MPYPESDPLSTRQIATEPSRKNRVTGLQVLKHLLLFILTFLTVTFVGIMWVGHSANADSYWEMWPQGALFATLLLAFLATHEFGHYFAAVYHNVKVTLPYFIPIPIGIGTLGAVIRIEERIRDTRSLFDIGIAGPIAGFVVSLVILLYGFATLPDPSFIENFAGHAHITEIIEETGAFPDSPPEAPEGSETLFLGYTLLYSFLASFFDNVPPMYEMYHYPFLFAGWLGLFFTALNLTPVGQLDGGHILYSLIGYEKQKKVARIAFGGILTLAGMEAIPFLFSLTENWLPVPGFSSFLLWGIISMFLLQKGYRADLRWIAPVWTIALGIAALTLFFGSGIEKTGSMIWVFWSFFIVYFVRIEHPPVLYERALSPARRRLGWISMAIFILCISPNPIYFIN